MLWTFQKIIIAQLDYDTDVRKLNSSSLDSCYQHPVMSEA